MYCTNCGSEVREGATFCSQCGSRVESTQASTPEPVPQPEAPAESPADWREHKSESAPKPRKRSRKPIAIAAALVAVVVIAVVVVLVIGGDSGGSNSSGDSAYAEAAENYLAVNEALTELVESSEYQDADTSERMLLVADELAALEDEGQIEPDSVSNNEESGLVSYRYANGAGGGVMTEDFPDEESGAGTSSYVTSYQESGLVEEFATNTSFATEDFWPYEEEELSALVVQGLGEGREDDEADLDEVSGYWTADGLTTTTEDSATVDKMHTCLAGYDLVVIQLHGLLDGGTPMVYLQETTGDTFGNDLFSWFETTSFLSEEAQVYYDDLAASRVNMYLNEDGLYHFALAPSFFTYYYDSAGLDGEIFWLGCCSGYTNDELVSAVAGSGADAVVGCTESVNTHYNILMQHAFVYSLLYGNTVGDSLEFAQSIWGENDSIYVANYSSGETVDDTPSELRAYNGSDVTLVTLTEEAEESLAGGLAVYQEVIDQYAQAYQAYLDGDLDEYSMAEEQCEDATDCWTWPISDDYPYVTQDILCECWRYGDEVTLTNYYCLYDINGDGADELLIGEADGDFSLWAIFTCEDGAVIPLFANAYRTSYWPCTDGTIGMGWFGGWATGGYQYYTFSGSEITVVETLDYSNYEDEESVEYKYTALDSVAASGTEDVDAAFCDEGTLTTLINDLEEGHPRVELGNLEWIEITTSSDAD